MVNPEEALYTKEHEWVFIRGNTATVGVTDHAQRLLSDVVFVELPETGKSVKQFEALAVIETVKAVSDVFAPMSGEVARVNDALTKYPELINQSPFDQGWIARIKISDPEEKKNLMTRQQYLEYIQETGK